MKESILHNVVRCSKCGEHYYKYRGVSDSRCESCWEEEPKVKHWEDVEYINEVQREAHTKKGS